MSWREGVRRVDGGDDDGDDEGDGDGASSSL
jgi:hypothetical protein